MTLQNGQIEPVKTGTEFKDKLAVIGRMILTGSGVAFSIFGFLGILNGDQVKEATPVIQDIVVDAQKLASDLYALWGIVGVSLLLAAGKFGLGAASLPGKLRSITNNKEVKVNGTIEVSSQAIANSVPSPKVVGPSTM